MSCNIEGYNYPKVVWITAKTKNLDVNKVFYYLMNREACINLIDTYVEDRDIEAPYETYTQNSHRYTCETTISCRNLSLTQNIVGTRCDTADADAEPLKFKIEIFDSIKYNGLFKSIYMMTKDYIDDLPEKSSKCKRMEYNVLTDDDIENNEVFLLCILDDDLHRCKASVIDDDSNSSDEHYDSDSDSDSDSDRIERSKFPDSVDWKNTCDHLGSRELFGNQCKWCNFSWCESCDEYSMERCSKCDITICTCQIAYCYDCFFKLFSIQELDRFLNLFDKRLPMNDFDCDHIKRSMKNLKAWDCRSNIPQKVKWYIKRKTDEKCKYCLLVTTMILGEMSDMIRNTFKNTLSAIIEHHKNKFNVVMNQLECMPETNAFPGGSQYHIAKSHFYSVAQQRSVA